MSDSTKPKKIPNDLWIARKRLGLEQKHIACLMHHKNTAQVSRYEKGTQVPGLRMLIQLEIIYGTPLKFLYPELYEQLRLEISERIAQNAHFAERYKGITPRLRATNTYCAYLELLEKPTLSEEEKTRLRKHTLHLLRQSAEPKYLLLPHLPT